MTEFYTGIPDDRCIPLWSSSFGDSEEFISEALRTLGRSAICASLELDGRRLSQCLLIEHRVGSCRGLYIYAACTDEERRGEGLFGRLLEQVSRYATERCFDLLSLIPANRELAAYYEHRGFTGKLPLSASHAPTTPEDIYRSIDPSRYTDLPGEGDLKKLYAMSRQCVSLDTFRYVCNNIAEVCEICAALSVDGRRGYVIRHRKDRSRVFDASANFENFMTDVTDDSRRAALLVKRLSDKALAIEAPFSADPLPR